MRARERESSEYEKEGEGVMRGSVGCMGVSWSVVDGAC